MDLHQRLLLAILHLAASRRSGPLLHRRSLLPRAGGSVWEIPDPNVAVAGGGAKTDAVRATFYGAYNSSYNGSLEINTPITADSNGNIYFGYVTSGSTLPTGVTSGGIARISASGQGTFVSASAASSDSNIVSVALSSAPAVSPDGSTVYVAVTGPYNDDSTDVSYLLALNSTTLATKGIVAIEDPRTNTGMAIINQSTASPMVAPDGTVFFGIWAYNTTDGYNGSRGFMLHFSANLATEYTPVPLGGMTPPALFLHPWFPPTPALPRI